MSIVTFNFTHASELRRFSILLPSTAAPYPLPVVLTLECRATTEQQATGSWLQRYEASAARLGIAMVGLTTTDRRLEPPAAPVRECWDWPNDGIINDAQPQACDSSDSKDVGYLQYVLDFLAARPQSFDSTQLYLEGFSKDAVAAAVLAYCFPTRIAGVYQGGSALLVRGLEPTIYHHIGTECTQTGYETLGEDCRTIAPCTACQYLGIVPCWSPRRPMVHCLGSFADDYFAPAQDHMVRVWMLERGLFAAACEATS